jgi:hypothetical protein
MSILSLLSVPRRLLASNATAVASSVKRGGATTTTANASVTTSLESASETTSDASSAANTTKNLKLIAGKSLIADYIARNDVPAAAQMLG